MENIIDYSFVNNKPDYVVCNYCGTYMYVDCDTHICPHCGKDGGLMDIEQEVDLDK